MVQGQRKPCMADALHRQTQKGSCADKGNEKAVEERAGESAGGKQAFVPGTGRPPHKMGRILRIDTERQSRQAVRNQVNPENVTGLQRRIEIQ